MQSHSEAETRPSQPQTSSAGHNWKKKIAPDGLFVVLLLVAVLVFFKEAIVGDRTVIWDTADDFYPRLFFISDAFRHGNIPFWNPFLFNGFPSIGAIQTQTFYPPNFLFMIFTKFSPYAVQMSLILHFFMAGVFMYFLSRFYTQNRWASGISALAYMFSGYMVGHIEHLTIIDFVAWLPLVFLLLDMAIVRNDLRYSFIAGFFFGVSILAGHPQSTHAIVYVLTIHALYRAASSFIREKSRSLLLKPLLALVICLGLGLLISAVQVVPTYELVKESIRAGKLPFEIAAGSGQFSLEDAGILLLPNYFGAVTGPYWNRDLDISQDFLYMGIMPVLFVVLALMNARKDRDIVYFFIAALFWLLISLGEHGFIFRLLYNYAPGFDRFRSPVNTVFISIFFGALLAGRGVNFLSPDLKNWKLHISFGIILALGLTLYFTGPYPPDEIADPALRHINRGIVFFVVFFFVSAVVMAFSVRMARYRKICLSILVLLTFSDLYINLSDAITIGQNASAEILEKEPEILTVIKGMSGIASGPPRTELSDADIKEGLFRVYTQPAKYDGTAAFGYNRAMLHRLFLVEGMESLEMSRHRKLVDVLSVSNLDNLLRITNSKYVTSLNDRNVDLRVNPNFMPRTFIVPNARFISDDDRVLKEIAKFDPLKEVILSGNGMDVTGRTTDTTGWQSLVTRYTGNLVEIRTQSSEDGFLILSDTYYPGWQAAIDGVDVPVLRANYDFRAVSLPRGDHTVVFRFKPSSFSKGLAGTVAGLILTVLGWLYMRNRRV